MKIKSDNPTVENGTTYQGFTVTIGNTIWVVVAYGGKFNGVRVRKASNNPWRTMGKTFETFAEAIDNYKSPKMKNMLSEIHFNFEITNNVVVD